MFHLFSCLTSVQLQKCLLVLLFLFTGIQASFAQADLAIQGAAVSPTSIAAGNNITATSTIYNLGGTSATSSSIGYYLSTDNLLDGNDTFIGSSSGGSLGVAGSFNSSSYRSTIINIPATTTTGSYYLLFVADYLNGVSELNENNNVSSVSIAVVPPSVDFSISSAYVYYTSVVAGNSLYTEVNVINLGNTASTSSTVGYYLSTNNTYDASDVFIGSSSGGAITPGYSNYFSSSVTIPANTPAGNYYIIFVADYLNSVVESNESNNTTARQISVTAQSVDLMISSANVYGSNFAPGSSFSTESYIYNQGNTTASSSNIGYYLSSNNSLDEADVFLGSSTGGSLYSGSGNYKYATLTVPTNTPVGNYYIIFVADYLNTVTESSETNNTASVSITVAAPFVDLVVQSNYLYSNSVMAGGQLYSESRITNRGNSTASSSNMGYYLSTNSTYDESDVFVGSTTGSSLAAGNYSYHSTTLTIPANTSPGSYYLLFVADYLNTVAESNETNNINYSSLTVVSPSIDLSITNFSLSSSSVSAGNPVTSYITIYNLGNTQATSSNVGFYLSANATFDASDVLVGYQNGGTLYGSYYDYRTASVTIPQNTTPGLYYLIAVADYLNTVSETNETNNTASNAITITEQGTTFLVPQSGSSSFTTCTGTLYDHGGTGSYSNSANGSLTLTPATSGNKISLTFSTFSVEGCCDGLYIYDGNSTSSPLIGYYTSNPGTVYATSTTGALTLRFVSDGSVTYQGFEAEIACVTSVPLPDLTIQTPNINPASITAGNYLFASCSILNQGTAASSSNVGYYLSTNTTFETSDVYLGSSSGYSMVSGASSYRESSLSIPANTAAGQYYVLFVADPSNLVNEENEVNNVSSLALTVTAPSIDLMVLSAFTSVSTLTPGNTFTVSSFVANAGSSSASSSNVGYYLSANNTLDGKDVYLGQTLGSTLASGSSAQRSTSLSLPGTTTAGNYFILFVADHTNIVPETNENNNLRTVAVTVSSTNNIDLDFTASALSRTSVLSGDTIRASVTLQNKGNVTAPQSIVGYYLSSNTTVDSNDIFLDSLETTTTLAANATTQLSALLTIPEATTSGTYYILIKSDYENHIAESNETNGFSSLALSVNPATVDLQLASAAVTPATVVAGNTVSASVTIKNEGTLEAASSNVDYYLSTNSTLDVNDVALSSSTGGALAPGASATKSATLTIPAGTTAGSYYILFIADRAGSVEESVETNNVVATAITVSARAVDLVMQSPRLSASTVVQGNTVTATSSIKNNGTIAATSSAVGYYLSTNNSLNSSDISLGTSAGGNLAASASASKSATLTIPAGTAAGNYFILFVADPANAVTESSETNNVSSVALAVTVPPTDVDLAIQTPRATPTTIVSGGTTAVSSSIINNGAAEVASSNVGYYLSANNTYENSDIALGKSTGEALAGGASATKTATLTIPAGTAAGSYFILFIADNENDVAETNETNNAAAVAITVTAPTVDLVIQNPAISPNSVVSGSTITATSNIRNSGTSAATASKVGYYLSSNTTLESTDIALGNSAGGSLAAGASASKTATLTIPATTVAGNYYVLFVADPDQAVSESNESNNVSSVALAVTVASRPDLVAAFAQYTPILYYKGVNYGIKAIYTNQGTVMSEASAVGYYLSDDNSLDANDTFVGASRDTILEAGINAVVTGSLEIPENITAGSYFLLAVADYQNKVIETIENNNVSALAITVEEASSDLVLESATVNPAISLAGATVTTNVTIRNTGSIPALSSNIGYYLSANNTFDATDVILGSTAGGRLDSGSSAVKSATLTIPTGTAAGSYFILLVADPANLVEESNESNNLTALSFTVTNSAPDLIIQNPGLSTTVVAVGESISATGTIKNDGNAAASSSQVAYYLSTNTTLESSDVLLNTSNGNTLAAGATASRTASLTIPAGTVAGAYYILFVADPTQLVTESNETNNVSSVTITVTDPPMADLVMFAPVTNWGSTLPGSNITVTSTYTNSGNQAAQGSKVSFYLSADTTYNSADILLAESETLAVAVNETITITATVTIPPTTAHGNYYIIAVADADNLIAESNKDNNTASVSIYVGLPNTTTDLLAEQELTVWPNPTTDMLHIAISGIRATEKSAEIMLYNSIGEKVLVKTATIRNGKLNQTLDLRKFSKGVYFVHVRTGAAVSVQKIVVQK